MNYNKPKIAIYIESLAFGGAERVTIYLADFFSKSGYDVQIITNIREKKGYTLDKNIKRTILNSKNKKINILRYAKELRNNLKKESIDVMLVMNTYLTPISILATKTSKTKVIVSERNSPRNFSGRRITKLLTNIMLRFCDGYIFQTTGAKEYYTWLTKESRIIPNPLFTEELPNPQINKRNKVIVNVARLHEQKNQQLLIKSFSKISQKYPDHKLIIYGEGNKRKELENLIKRLNLVKQVKLPGAFNNVLDKINGSELFVLSSDYEGMPNALIEAMALGIPVISTNCPSGGPSDLILDGINGLLTPVNDVTELSIQMDRLLSDKKLSRQISENALRIREDLDADKIGNQWLDFTLKIVNQEYNKPK